MPAPVMPPPTIARSNCSFARLWSWLDLPPLTGAFVGDVVTQNGSVIEAELAGQRVEREGAGLGGVVGGLRLSLGPADVDGRERVLAWVARGVGVGEELLGEIDLE